MTDIQEFEQTQRSQEINGNESEKRKKNKFAVKEDVTEENCKFDEGQLLRFVRVRFPGHAKSYAFLIGKRNLMYGQKVMAMSDRGMAVGYINSFEYELPFTKTMLPLRTINKMASEEDIEKEHETYKKQKEVETLCQNLIDKHKLDMNLTHVEFTQFGKKVVFYFVAPARVDFRGLVKDLVSELRLRIELRQISVRDRAASQGALGPCGRELCCSSFLSKYGNVSIKMAKNQDLTLNYSKLNGVCGQLKCCLQYEDEVYAQKRKHLPKEGELIETRNGDKGKIRKLNILSEQFDLLTIKGKIKRYTYDQYKKSLKDTELKFPRHFDNISDETGQIIGLNEQEAKKTRQFERDMEKISKRAKRYAHDRVEEISEFLPERDRSSELAEIEAIKISSADKFKETIPQQDVIHARTEQDTGTEQSESTASDGNQDKSHSKQQRRPRPKNYRKNSGRRGKRPQKGQAKPSSSKN